LCPGPALANIATLSPQAVIFAAAMAAGMVIHDLGQTRKVPVKNEPVRDEEALATATDG
jgi:hypothetical protein